MGLLDGLDDIAQDAQDVVDEAEDAIQEQTGIDLGNSGSGDVKDTQQGDTSGSFSENQDQKSSNGSSSDSSTGSSGSSSSSETGQTIQLNDNPEVNVSPPSVDDDDDDSGGNGSSNNSKNSNKQTQRPENVRVAATVTQKEEKKGIADEITEQAKAEETRKNIQENKEFLKNLDSDQQVTLGGEKIEAGKALNRVNENLKTARQRENALETAVQKKSNLEKVVRAQDNLDDAQKTIPGNEARKGSPLYKSEFGREVSQLQNQSNKKVAGQLVQEGILGQLAEAGETTVETGVNRAIPGPAGEKFINQNIQDVGTAFNLDFGVQTETGKGSPQEAFGEQLAELSVAQSRAKNVVSDVEKKVPDQVEEIAVDRIQSLPGTGLNLNSLEGVDQASEKVLKDLPGYGAKEVPEKATELAALSGAAAATFQNPEQVAKTTASGASSLAGNIAKDPVGFGVGEIAVDVGLDVATGGGVPVAVPAAESVSTKANQAKTGAQRLANEFKALREGGKQSDPLTDLALEAALSRPEANVLTAGTASPTSQPEPQPEPEIDVLQPESFETLDIVQTESVPETQSLAPGLGLSGVFPSDESLSNPLNRPVAQPRSQTKSVPEAVPQAQALTLSTTQALVEPQVEPVPENQPLTIPQESFEEEDKFNLENSGSTKDQNIKEETEFASSLAGSLGFGSEELTITKKEAGKDPLLTGFSIRR